MALSFIGAQWFTVAALFVAGFMVGHKFQHQALLYLLTVIYATPQTLPDFVFITFLSLVTVAYSAFRNAASS